MNTRNQLRRLFFSAVVLASLGLMSNARAQDQSPVALLQSAYVTLAGADHDYDGRRVAAMRQIGTALREIEGDSAPARIRRVHYKHVGKVGRGYSEPQATSDAKLRSAESMLQTASANLSGAQLAHVNRAIAQLNTALGIR